MERIKLDLVPGCVKPILHASQYDNGREWTCDILDNGVPYKFASGDSCEIHVRKGDNCAVTASVPVTVGQSYVVVTSTEQMCAVSGDNLAELVIMNGTKKIGSCNLILSVEADPLNGSKSSASEIHDLQAQVNDCVDEALSHKGASDIAFDNTGTGLEATNVQSAIEEVNTKTDAKADANDVYDKEYMDGIFEQIDNAFTNVDNTKMNKANPTGTGSFSFNRREGSTVGDKSVALGDRTIASGANSFTSGYGSVASGAKSTAMGSGNRASGNSSMAINSSNTASGDYSLAQGGMCEATEYCSHAEGYSAKASGYVSHAEGQGTIANHISQHASGEFNIPDDSSAPEYSRGKYVEIVGNGTSDNNRSNARTLDWQGNETLAGDLIINGNQSVSGEITRLDGRIDNLPEPMVFKGTLGVGGTIQSLPTASAENEGWMFKCITAGTYAGLTLKVGDTVTCFNPPNTSTYYWDKTGSQDTDTDTWRNIKVNGVEKLGNGISSGSLDVVDTDNIEAEFDNDGNKLKLKTKNIYTQAQVDSIVSDAIYNVLPDDTASGAIANFNTSLALPLKSLGIDVNAVQASGTPTPSTPIPISGWSAIKIVHTGKNLTNATTTNTVFWGTDVIELIQFLNTLPIGRYTISNKYKINEVPSSGKVLHGAFLIRALVNGEQINVTPYLLVTDNNPSVGKVYQESVSFEITDAVEGKINHVYAYCDQDNPHSGSERGSYDCYDIQIETGSVATDYEPYDGNEYIINLGDTYYGGHFTQDKDGHRRFEVTCAKETVSLQGKSYDTANGYDAWLVYLSNRSVPAANSTNKKCSVCGTYRYEGSSANQEHFYITASALAIYLTENTFRDGSFEFVYPLETPIIIDLPDGEPINTFAGVNNFFADTGDSTVVFKSSVNDYVSAHSGGNLLGMGGVYLGGAKSGGGEEETDEDEDTEKTKLDEPKEEIKTIGDTKKLGGE